MVSAAWTPLLASAALLIAKSTLLLAAALGVTRVLGRGSAATRHLVWSLALGGMLLLPALVLLLPGWRLAFLAFLSPAAASATRDAAAGVARWAPPRLQAVLVGAWAAGALLAIARVLRGLRAAGRLARGAEEVTDPAWTDLLERLGSAMGVRGAVLLLRSGRAAMPLTWGAVRPAILLPAGCDDWPAERRRVVLLHELAHVARRDCLMQTLAGVCCALYWFHPGAWWAAREMRREREQACDDRVLAAGARASDYAGHLLDVARGYRLDCAAAIAMARPSQLEGRVRAVLAAERDRRAVTRRTGAVCAVAALLAMLPLAAVAPSERPAPRSYVWELPPARSGAPAPASRPEFRIVASVRRAPREAPRTPQLQPRTRRIAAPSAPATRVAGAAAALPTLAARVDDDGKLQLRLSGVRAPRDLGQGVRVSVGGHGVTTASVEIRLEPKLRAMIAAAAGDSCPDAARGRGAKKPVLAGRGGGGGADLALRMLGELNATITGRRPGAPPAPGGGGI